MIAKKYNSEFLLSNEAFNGIKCASDGKIYYILSSDSFNQGGKICRFDPLTQTIELLADLTEVCGEVNGESIPQSKTHSGLFERKGRLYFSTHVGYYEKIDGMEKLPVNAPAGLKLYPGAHIISYDIVRNEFNDLVRIPCGQGIITMEMDEERGHIYAIGWPKGRFIHYDVDKDELNDLGPVDGLAESGNPGENYRILCRSMLLDPRDGTVYFSTASGDIFYYKVDNGVIRKLEGINLRLDYFGAFDITRPGNMGYNWRKIVWNPKEEAAYGVQGKSGYLFRFDPRIPEIELIERIASEPSKKAGMFDRFGNGYLGFELDFDQQMIYYLTGGPIDNGNDVSIGRSGNGVKENLHLVTYHIPEKKYMDHGAVYLDDGTIPANVNSIAINPAGDIYTLARIGKNVDLMEIPNPF